MTLRESAAVAAMQALLSRDTSTPFVEIVNMATGLAEFLCSALGEPVKPALDWLDSEAFKLELRDRLYAEEVKAVLAIIRKYAQGEA